MITLFPSQGDFCATAIFDMIEYLCLQLIRAHNSLRTDATIFISRADVFVRDSIVPLRILTGSRVEALLISHAASTPDALCDARQESERALVGSLGVFSTSGTDFLDEVEQLFVNNRLMKA